MTLFTLTVICNLHKVLYALIMILWFLLWLCDLYVLCDPHRDFMCFHKDIIFLQNDCLSFKMTFWPSNDLYAVVITMCDFHNYFCQLSQQLCVPLQWFCTLSQGLCVLTPLSVRVTLTLCSPTRTLCCFIIFVPLQWWCAIKTTVWHSQWPIVPFTMACKHSKWVACFHGDFVQPSQWF